MHADFESPPQGVPAVERPIVLIAAAPDTSLADLLEGGGYAVATVTTMKFARERAPHIQPDAILLCTTPPGTGAVEVCGALRRDPRIAELVPIIVLTSEEPTPPARTSALRAGAWDCLRYPHDLPEVLVKLETYVQAKRSVDALMAEGRGTSTAGFHSRASLVRRARELGAVMARKHGALACVVFAWDIDNADPAAASLVSRTARVLKSAERLSDVIGVLGPTQFAVVAPATDHAGALKLVHRRVAAVQAAFGDESDRFPGAVLRVGYDAVTNLRYSPIDPADLLARAMVALRSGTPEPGYPWVRRYDPSATAAESQLAGVGGRKTPI